MPFIISASRRTDIPAFYSTWFKNRIKEGYAMVRHPFSKKNFRVSLEPEDVVAIVFWTKNFKPMLSFIPELEERGYFYLVHYTITGLGKSFEPNTPKEEESIETILKLSLRTGKQRILWRFDPIIFTERIRKDETLERFERLAGKLSGYVERCYFSFLDRYERVERRIEEFQQKKEGELIITPTQNEAKGLVEEMVKIAHSKKISLHSCCEPEYIGFGVEKASCIDAPYIQGLTARSFEIKRNPTRKGCGCYFSYDIGAYDSCPHLCFYCYANSHPDRVKRSFRSHNAQGEFLVND